MNGDTVYPFSKRRRTYNIVETMDAVYHEDREKSTRVVDITIKDMYAIDNH